MRMPTDAAEFRRQFIIRINQLGLVIRITPAEVGHVLLVRIKFDAIVNVLLNTFAIVIGALATVAFLVNWF